MKKRVTGFKALSEASNIPVRTLRSLWAAGMLPGEVCGHRTILFVLERVERALERRTVKIKGTG
jgi:hypothetical protein